jgi:adenylate cyclase
MKGLLARLSIGQFRSQFGVGTGVSGIGWLVILGGIALTILLWSGYLGPLSRFAHRMEELWQDRLSTLLEPTPEREDLVFLGIDEASTSLRAVDDEELAASPVLEMMAEPWPWNRRVYAEVINRLGEAGARLIILDIYFPGPSRDPEADRLFAEAVDRYRDKLILAAQWSPVGEHQLLYGEPFELLAWGESGNTASGFVNFWPDDRDGILRDAQYRISGGEANGVERHEDEPVYDSLAMAAGRKLGAVPTADTRRLRFAVGGENNQRTVGRAYAPRSIYTIFTDQQWRDLYDEGRFFENKTVVIGPASPLYHDQVSTPSGVMYGAQMHLQALGCMLEGSYWKKMPVWLEWVIMLSMCFVGAALVYSIRNPLKVLGALMLVGVLFVAGCALLASGSGFFPGILFGGVSGVFGLLFVTVGGEAAEFFIEQRERVRLHRQFRRSVSRDVADAMVKAPEGYYDAARGGRRVVAVLFSDVRDFTTRSEQMEPELLVRQLNEYFSDMVEAVFVSGGTIDKFIGDAVMASWGGLVDCEERQMARNALNAAEGMRERLHDLNRKWEGEGVEGFEVGIGIHLGEAVVGEIGSDQRSDFTAIGDAVNVASRVEGMTKMLGVPLLVTGRVAEALGEPAGLCFLGSFRVKGRQEGLEVYTSSPGRTEDWDEAMALIGRGEFAEAEPILASLPEDHPLAGTARFYRRLIATWKVTPPADWNGIVTLESK